MWPCRLPHSVKRPGFLKRSSPVNFAPRSNKLAASNRLITKVTHLACCAESPESLEQLSASRSSPGARAHPPGLGLRNAKPATDPPANHEEENRGRVSISFRKLKHGNAETLTSEKQVFGVLDSRLDQRQRRGGQPDDGTTD